MPSMLIKHLGFSFVASCQYTCIPKRGTPLFPIYKLGWNFSYAEEQVLSTRLYCTSIFINSPVYFTWFLVMNFCLVSLRALGFGFVRYKSVLAIRYYLYNPYICTYSMLIQLMIFPWLFGQVYHLAL